MSSVSPKTHTHFDGSRFWPPGFAHLSVLCTSASPSPKGKVEKKHGTRKQRLCSLVSGRREHHLKTKTGATFRGHCWRSPEVPALKRQSTLPIGLSSGTVGETCNSILNGQHRKHWKVEPVLCRCRLKGRRRQVEGAPLYPGCLCSPDIKH